MDKVVRTTISFKEFSTVCCNPHSQRLEKALATHSSTLAWKILWMEESGRLQSMGSLRVRHDWTTSLSLFTFMHWRRKWQPFQCSCLGNPMDRGAWWATGDGVTRSWTQLSDWAWAWWRRNIRELFEVMEMFFHIFKKNLIVYLVGCAGSWLQHTGSLVMACGI